ncbi:MAG: hypothetical protein AAB646_01940 [Patescibacteria group bacterium]
MKTEDNPAEFPEEVCQTCSGTGKLPQQVEDGSDIEFTNCPDCDGRGKK